MFSRIACGVLGIGTILSVSLSNPYFQATGACKISVHLWSGCNSMQLLSVGTQIASLFLANQQALALWLFTLWRLDLMIGVPKDRLLRRCSEQP